MITGGCGSGTKGSSSHSLLLALSLTIWGTALCARQPASHLGRRHYANSFVSSKGHTLGLHGRWQTPFSSHEHLWTWVEVIGFGGCPRSNYLALAGLKWCASRNAMASHGTKTGEDWRRYTTIKPNQHNRMPFTYQLPKTKEKRTNKRHYSTWYD